MVEPSGEIRISDNSRIVFYGIYIPVDTFRWVLPHLLKIQRLSEARVSGGNLFRRTTDSTLVGRLGGSKIYKISAQRARR